MMSTYGSHIMDSNDLICHRHSHNSEILYVVIITIKCAIYTLYIVFVLIWLHLSFIVIDDISRIYCGGGS